MAIFDIDVKWRHEPEEAIRRWLFNDIYSAALQGIAGEPFKEPRNWSPKSLKERVARFEVELSYQDKFDKVVVNKDFDMAYMRAKNCITAFLQPQTTHIY